MASWVFPVLIVFALLVTASYFIGRRRNLLLMSTYARDIEGALRPTDKEYSWIGGYIGFRADYRTGQKDVKRVKATLQLLPRMSLLYFPIAKVTMRHDKLYFIVETSGSIAGEAHLIQKGHYRLIPPGIEHPERFRRKELRLGDRDFELLDRDGRGEGRLLPFARKLDVDTRKIKHLSFTSSTNVAYAFVEPAPGVVRAVLPEMLRFAAGLVAR